ncbi:MAG: FcoT family thioesterase [Polyangiaceae bacterium]
MISNQPVPLTERLAKERWDISPELLSRVLIPYRDHCKYLLGASMEYRPIGPDVNRSASESSIAIEGEMSIGDSCYIDSTGHFNAVEFQICANQLLYTMGAECVRRGLVEAFAPIALEGYFDRQLPNVLITNVTSTFRRIIDPRSFRGRAELDRSYRMKDRVFWECSLVYTDAEGGLADGSVVVTMSLGDRMPAFQK